MELEAPLGNEGECEQCYLRIVSDATTPLAKGPESTGRQGIRRCYMNRPDLMQLAVYFGPAIL